MKKLFIFILFTFLVLGLFAEKIPKGPLSKTEPYTYISKDGRYEYSVVAATDINNLYCIDLIKINIETEYMTRIQIVFDTESQIDNFINNFKLSKFEKEFDRINNIVLGNDAYIRTSNKAELIQIKGSDIKF